MLLGLRHTCAQGNRTVSTCFPLFFVKLLQPCVSPSGIVLASAAFCLLHHMTSSFCLLAAVTNCADMSAGIPNPPAASNLDELWAKLQQQHSQEADALRSRRANSGSLPATDIDQGSLTTVLSAGPAGVASLSVASGSTVDKQVNESEQSPRPLSGQMSEADFWRDLQK